MSNRLESLNKKPSNGKPSLKFKPKVVERKSKEEREKSVKVKPDPDSKSSGKPFRNANKPKHPRSKQNAYANTHVLSSGLLSSATPLAGPSGSSRVTKSTSPNPEFLQSLKLKDTPKKSTDSEADSDNDDDLTKIDMSKEYKFAESETALFPVRPERSAEEPQDPKASKERSPVKEDPEFVRESSVKSENIETELQQILHTKADLETKISQPVDLLNLEESEKISDDYVRILHTINSNFDDENSKFTLLQLPKLLPNYTTSETAVKPETGEDIVEPTPPQSTNSFAADVSDLTGQIGKLNIHKSGKITINLGSDIDLGLTVGVGSNFLQELVMLDYEQSADPEQKPKTEDADAMDEVNESKGAVYKLGEVEGKFIATPIIS